MIPWVITPEIAERARRLKQSLCTCLACHNGEVTPPAVSAGMCEECAEDYFSPWTDTLQSMLT